MEKLNTYVKEVNKRVFNYLASIAYLILSVSFLFVAYLTATGELQSMIRFEDTLNEMFFFVFCIILSILFLTFLFPSPKSKK